MHLSCRCSCLVVVEPLDDMPRLVSLTEACRVLGISRGNAYRMIKRGDFPLPVIEIGPMKKINRAQLLAFVEGKQAG